MNSYEYGVHAAEASRRGYRRTAGSPSRPRWMVSDEPAKVVIEVSGGVAEVTSKPDNVIVEIIDHDNKED